MARHFRTLLTVALLNTWIVFLGQPALGDANTQNPDSQRHSGTRAVGQKKRRASRPAQSENPEPQKNKSNEPSAGVELKKATSLEQEKSSSFSRGDLITLIGTLATVAALLVVYHIRWKTRAEEARDDFKRHFYEFSSGELSKAVSADDAGELEDKFFRGYENDSNANVYVARNLDVRRPRYLEPSKQFLLGSHHGLKCVEIVGGRQQGKTLLLARLAQEFAADHGWRLWNSLRRWEVWTCNRTSVQHVFAHPDLIRRYFTAYHGSVWRPLARHKRLLLVLDDIATPQAVAASLAALRVQGNDFVNTLVTFPIAVLVSCVGSVLPHKPYSVRTLPELQLQKEDISQILDKWVDRDRLDKPTAENLKTDAMLRRLYGKQLFAFLCVLFKKQKSNLKPQPTNDFLKKFDTDYQKCCQAHTDAILAIAACELLRIAVPFRLIRKLDSAFTLDQSFVLTNAFAGRSDDLVYETGGAFLPKWLLEDKQGKSSFTELKEVYTKLLDAAEALKDFGVVLPSERRFVATLLSKLTEGVPRAVFRGRSEKVAGMLLKHSLIRRRTQALDEGGTTAELAEWAILTADLHDWESANPLFLKALVACANSEYLDPECGLHLLASIRRTPDKNLLASAKDICASLLQRVVQDRTRKHFATAYLHVYTDLLRRLPGGLAHGIAAWHEHVVKKKNVEADAGLYMRLGELEEALGKDLRAAYDAFSMAVKLAEAEGPAQQVSTTQRLATFLSRYPGQAEGKLVDQLFQTARQAAVAAGVPWQPIANEWAQYKVSLAAKRTGEERVKLLVEAEQLLRDAQKAYEDTVESHTWLTLATFLQTKVDDFGLGGSEELVEAERLCREVIDDEYVNRESKLMAKHQLGALVALSDKSYTYVMTVDGRQPSETRPRPARAEGLRILRGAFESVTTRKSKTSSTYQDAITHRLIKDIYQKELELVEGFDPERIESVTERARRLLRREEFHANHTFEGLCGSEPEPARRIKEHVLLSRDWFAYFLWGVKHRVVAEKRKGIIIKAYRHYLTNIEDLERWGMGADSQEPWNGAFRIYLHVVTFGDVYGESYELEKGKKQLLLRKKGWIRKLIVTLPAARIPDLLRDTKNGVRVRQLLEHLRSDSKKFGDTDARWIAENLEELWTNDLQLPLPGYSPNVMIGSVSTATSRRPTGIVMSDAFLSDRLRAVK